MLSSICFMPTSLIPQSFPPRSPSIASYFGENIVVICMRAGLYQQKNGLLLFFGSLRSSQSITWEEISSSTVFDRSNDSGPSSLPDRFLAVPSQHFIQRIGPGGVKHVPFFRSTPRGGLVPARTAICK